jgi:diaminohydroxyphosphoribosylaminopyrimidine deaminase/5-amino-6-(5-phosphoribosylamino)uracil reductase
LNADSIYIRRCLELALNGIGKVAPNPMVGAVLVHDNKIIAEGYHQRYGQSHAEVNAIDDAIKNGNEGILDKSILYVNLEPCNHQGQTPPCTELIINKKIPVVKIGCQDPNPNVNGNGIERLRNAGIEVFTNILEKECLDLNRRFITYHVEKRPYVILKYAQTADGFISPFTDSQKVDESKSFNLMERKISNEFSDRIVHKWRSEEPAIMIGTKTALQDNPFLTVRKWKGENPLRIVIDRNLKLHTDLNIFNNEAPTIIFNDHQNNLKSKTEYLKIDFNKDIISQIIRILYERKILSVIVEGGTNLLNQFIVNNLWDEARIITAKKKFKNGIHSPRISGFKISSSDSTGDNIVILRRDK